MGFDGGSGRPYGEPGTRNPEPGTPNSEPGTPNSSERRTANETEAGIRKGNTEYRIQKSEYGIRESLPRTGTETETDTDY